MGVVISEFVGLRAKLYCINSNTSLIKKAKGVKKCIVNKLSLDMYKNALMHDESFRDTMYLIRSKNHKVYTQKVNKLVLNASDDKRQILEGGYSTLPWGHYATMF